MQYRVGEYGQTITAEGLRVLASAISHGQGRVVDGFDLSIPEGTVNQYAVSPGIAVTPEAVVVFEDAPKVIKAYVGPLNRAETLILRHRTEGTLGGVEATLAFVPQHYESFKGATVLGWRTYPGGSVAASLSQFVPAPRMRENVLDAGQFDILPHLCMYAPLAEVADIGSDAQIVRTVTRSNYLGRDRPSVLITNSDDAEFRTWRGHALCHNRSRFGRQYPFNKLRIKYQFSFAQQAGSTLILENASGQVSEHGLAAANAQIGVWQTLERPVALESNSGSPIELRLSVLLPASAFIRIFSIELLSDPFPDFV